MTRSVALLLMIFATVLTTGGQVSTASDKLMKSIDANTSAGDDFYQFVNGSKGSALDSAFTTRSEDLMAREKRIAEHASSRVSAVGTDARLIGDYWFTGMNVKVINDQGLKPLQPDFDRIDKVHSVEDLISVAAAINRKSLFDGVLFNGYVWRDEKNSSTLVYNLAAGGLTLESTEFYSANNNNAEKVRTALRTYLLSTFTRLYGDTEKARAAAETVFDLEHKMARVSGPDGYRQMSFADLRELAPQLHLDIYLREIGVKDTGHIVMKNTAYFEHLNSLFSSIPLSVWKDYLRFRLIKLNAPDLDDRAYGDFFEYDRSYTGAQRPRDRWIRVLRRMDSRLGQPLARLFVNEYHAGSDKPRYLSMAVSIREAFRKRISSSDWMSDATKQNAIKKLDAMRLTIGFPDKWGDFSSLRLKRDSYVLNVMRTNAWLNDQQISKVGSEVDRSQPRLQWSLRGDAAYDPTNNELILPASLFPSVSGSKDLPTDDASIYGTIGAGLGHEMSHGFDVRGRNFDATGTLKNWWTAQDTAEFNKRAKVLIDQYNEFEPIPGMRVNGTRTLSENMADLTGLLIALDAFKTTSQYKRGGLLNGYTPLQRFFIAFARTAAPQTKEYVATMLQGSDHSPDRERRNGVLMNVPEFYQAFDIKPTDRMFRPENKRVRLW